ncbi:hypothetical protein AB0B45_49280 [Nonomuraea sp. NPDC049152]|uniref:hypothetical protein n=1 Tax=Nonomuraea sp. NPDC049152 TaxID=3154350 RepID=UPI0033F809A4
MRITGHAEVRAVLSDPSYVPPPPPPGAAYGTLGWLRSQVSRFASGAVHAERRALVEGRLSRMDPAALRTAAAAATRALLTAPSEERPAAAASPSHETTSQRSSAPGDVDGRVLAYGVPTRVLGAALGIRDLDALVPAVESAATGYLSGAATPDTDAAVARLLTLAELPEITILLQAHGAVTALLRNALATPRATGTATATAATATATATATAESLLRDTLRHDPPVRATKRVDGTGALVEVDLTPDLPFGHGPRRCPGSDHAMAIATGVLETIMEYR